LKILCLNESISSNRLMAWNARIPSASTVERALLCAGHRMLATREFIPIDFSLVVFHISPCTCTLFPEKRPLEKICSPVRGPLQPPRRAAQQVRAKRSRVALLMRRVLRGAWWICCGRSCRSIPATSPPARAVWWPLSVEPVSNGAEPHNAQFYLGKAQVGKPVGEVLEADSGQI
jgi:hypothetical protein